MIKVPIYEILLRVSGLSVCTKSKQYNWNFNIQWLVDSYRNFSKVQDMQQYKQNYATSKLHRKHMASEISYTAYDINNLTVKLAKIGK